MRIYADEGISGVKIKNRTEFQRLMRDAKHGLFDLVVVKDISRFARNTVDLLNSTRQLKALGIETQFLTANMTSMGNSEFVLTIFGALAQEESANTSKRVKFGKKMNAEKGRVPNIVYGYDKTKGDYFNLTVNELEAKIINGKDSCNNLTKIDEAELTAALGEYFTEIMHTKQDAIKNIVSEFNRIYHSKDGKIDVYLKLLSDIGLDQSVLLSNSHTCGSDIIERLIVIVR